MKNIGNNPRYFADATMMLKSLNSENVRELGGNDWDMAMQFSQQVKPNARQFLFQVYGRMKASSAGELAESVSLVIANEQERRGGLN